MAGTRSRSEVSCVMTDLCLGLLDRLRGVLGGRHGYRFLGDIDLQA